MNYVSTRHSEKKYTLSEALQQSLASDGGLLVPETFPKFSLTQFSMTALLPEIAEIWLRPFFAGDELEKSLGDICRAAFNFPIPLNYLDEKTALLELFHGPTAAFKDVGARFLAECLSRIKSGQPLRTILVATSGDTGGAVAAAFHQRPGFQVWILFPQGKVSARQEKQLTAWGDNVRAFAVDGDFDDCQRMAKAAFNQPAWRNQYGLISANSINLGRLLPQAVYYVASGLKYLHDRKQIAGYIVPSGNLGNASAALWAKQTGMPIGHIVLAHNANRGVADFFTNGHWQALPTVVTVANAMDVGNPSNLERVRHLYPNFATMKQNISAFSVSDDQIRQSILSAQKKWNQIFCPHTAAGLEPLAQLKEKDWILVATAHAAKFESIVEPLLKQSIPIPAPLAAILNRRSVFTPIAASLDALAGALNQKG